MRIAVFGAGGIGGYLGARLNEVGEELIIIARGEHLAVIQEKGLKIESPKGNFIAHPQIATDDPSQVGEVDAILLGVKAWQIPEVTHALRPMLGPDTAVITLQNGVDTPSKVAAIVGAEHVVIGLAIVRCFIVKPGHLRHTVDLDPNVQIGEMERQSSERVKHLSQILKKAQLSVRMPEDIHAAMWAKFFLMSVMSAMGTVTRTTTEVWRSIPETRKMTEIVLSEAARVAKIHGVKLSDEIVENTMNLIDTMADGHMTSVANDIIEKRPSELEAVIGYLVRLGKELGIDMPVTSFIYNTLLPQELTTRSQFD